MTMQELINKENQAAAIANEIVINAALRLDTLKVQFMPRNKCYRVKLVTPLRGLVRKQICPGWKIYNILRRNTSDFCDFEKARVSVYSEYADIKLV